MIQETNVYEPVRESSLATYWLLRLKLAQQREGWEEGPTTEEVMEQITSFLFNREFDPGVESHRENIAEFIAEIEGEYGSGLWDDPRLVG